MAWFDRLRELFVILFTVQHPAPQQALAIPLLVASNAEGLFFRAVVSVPPPEGHVAMTSEIRAQVEHVTAEFSVLHREEAQYALHDHLGAYPHLEGSAPLPPGTVVTLYVDQDTHDVAGEHERIRLRGTVQEAEHQQQCERWSRQRILLTDPVLARMWWLDGHGDRLTQLVSLGDTFEEAARLLSADAPAANGGADTSRLIHDFVAAMGPDQQQFLAMQIAALLTDYEQSDLAQQVLAQG